jgi:hypothetical protein
MSLAALATAAWNPRIELHFSVFSGFAPLVCDGDENLCIYEWKLKLGFWVFFLKKNWFFFLLWEVVGPYWIVLSLATYVNTLSLSHPPFF